MGFAGQVFAARVAVGLAVPSQQSLNKAGGLIAGAVGGIYSKMRAKKLEAAKANLATTSQSLSAQGKQIKAFQAKSAKDLEGSSARTIKKIRALSSSGAMALESGGAISKLKSKMGKAAPGQFNALFKGIKMTGKAAMTETQQMAKMMSNFTKLTKEQRSAVVDFFKDRAEGSKQAVIDTGKLVKAGKATVEDLKKKVALHEENKQQLKEIGILERDHSKLVAALAKEESKLNKEEKELIALYKKHEKELKDVNAETKKQTQNLKILTNQAIDGLKRGFTDALRETVAAMTAFYYKLSQNTAALIDFERELLNANSVWMETRDILFDTGEMVTQFGQQFGLEMQNGATGLYQLASAGLTADEAMTVLPETLKLSMAVQGDHNTISKLTTQTIKGFGLEMNEASQVTDKFAHAIQKSLIEYEDLSSAVKFALPFFTATGQSIDQLLGALQVLTNRALEAGIAGRGLRQALAEFAEKAEDNTAAFKKMGINIKDAAGEMLPLTEIAMRFKDAVGDEVANNTELLTTLIDDLNVRGATAFIHLVQNAEEFQQAVTDTAESGGELDEMVRIQNESIQAQTQILKNNVAAIFFMRDANYEGTEFMNAFHEALVNGVQTLKDLIVAETDAGYQLTAFGQNIQDIAINGVGLMVDLLQKTVVTLRRFSEEGSFGISILQMYAIPLKLVVGLLEKMPTDLLKLLAAYHILNKVLQFQNIQLGISNAYNAIRIMLQSTYYAGFLQETRLQEMSTLQLIRHNYFLFMSNYIRKGNTISTWAGIKAKIADGVASIYQTAGTVLLTAAKWALSVPLMLIGGLMTGLATAAWLLLTPMGLWTAATWLLQTAMWALTMVPIVLLIVAIGLGIAGLIYGLYTLNKELGVTTWILNGMKDVWTSIAETVTMVWEDHIFPVIYRIGMEVFALGGIMLWLGQQIKEGLEGPWEAVMIALQPVFDLLSGLVGFLQDGAKWAYDLASVGWEKLVNGLMGAVKEAAKLFDWGKKILGLDDDRGVLQKDEDSWGWGYGPKKGFITDKLFAQGGYVKAMAQGGMGAGMNPYIVGEKGPELFMPNTSGKIISNKALNTGDRLDNILERMRGRSQAKMEGSKHMVVETLTVGKLKSKSSTIGINPFRSSGGMM
jgi:TP901 family phage tail tape measure protein